jgi:anti-sigma factor RsiW
MPTEQRMTDYLDGALTIDERTEFESELIANPEVLRELLDQRRLDAALAAMLDSSSQRKESAIMAGVMGASHETVEARVLKATILAPSFGHRRRAWSSWLYAWRCREVRWPWVGVAAAVVILGVLAGAFWMPRWTDRAENLPTAELASMSGEPELLRELALLVAPPPVWTGSEQQTAWLTILADATAPGGNER